MCNCSIPFLHPTARESDGLLAKGKRVNPPNLLNNVFSPEVFHAILSILVLFTFLTVFYFLTVIIIAPESSFVNKTCVLPVQINCVTQDGGKMTGLLNFCLFHCSINFAL